MDNPNQSAQSGTSPKTVAIVSHLTIIGFIIALIWNNNNKSELGSFYIRQMLGLILLSLAGGVVRMGMGGLGATLGGLISIVAFVLWILSFIGALNEEKKLLPIVGEYFQDWFKSI